MSEIAAALATQEAEARVRGKEQLVILVDMGKHFPASWRAHAPLAFSCEQMSCHQGIEARQHAAEHRQRAKEAELQDHSKRAAPSFILRVYRAVRDVGVSDD